MQPIKSFRVEIGEVAKFNIYLVGCGGTGSFAALHLARLAYVALQKGIDLRLIFIDHDHVETRNLGRQNFVEAELGQPKAVALARRYGYAFGLQIESRVAKFQAGMVQTMCRELALVIGCVDNAQARRELAKVGYGKSAWWLDSGNDKFSGQVMIGNGHETKIDPTGFATVVPRPDVQEPTLLDDARPEATQQAEAGLSCAQLLAMEAQSLMINQAMAGIVGTYAFKLIMARDLEVMKTYVNLESLSMRSEVITGEAGKIEVEEPKQVRVRRTLADAVAGGGAHPDLGYGIEFDIAELLEIQENAICPDCGTRVAPGRDTVNETEQEIVFCPTCQWAMTVEDLQQRILDAADAEEYEETMDGFYGEATEEEDEEELEGVL